MKIKKLLFYVLAGLLGGCIPVMSLHPLYTEEDVVFEEKLVGTWVDDSNGTWEFKHPDEKDMAYELVLFSPEGDKGLFVANLVKLENRLFLDVYPKQFPCDLEDPNKTEWGYNAFFYMPAHTFIKIDSIVPQLKMQLTDDERMGKLLTEDPSAVKHESIEDGGLILTASTKELQAFVLKYADDSRLFSDEIVYSRKKNQRP